MLDKQLEPVESFPCAMNTQNEARNKFVVHRSDRQDATHTKSVKVACDEVTATISCYL